MSDRLEDKLDKVIETTHRQEVSLEKLTVISEQNKEILDQHMERTAINESRIVQVETAFVKHLSFIKGAVWVFGIVSATIGILIKLKVL